MSLAVGIRSIALSLWFLPAFKLRALKGHEWPGLAVDRARAERLRIGSEGEMLTLTTDNEAPQIQGGLEFTEAGRSSLEGFADVHDCLPTHPPVDLHTAGRSYRR